MNILIVDDMERDRRMLRYMIESNRMQNKISEASSLGHMFAELAKPCDLLFLDISLNGNEKPDDQGLSAIYDIIDSYPDLPICMVTGYYHENLHRFLDEFLTKTTQVVNFLDKGTYGKSDLSKVFSTAEEYHSEVQRKNGDRRAAEELLEEAAENEKKRIQEEFSSDLEDIENRLKILELFKKAFEGCDWRSRIAAEAEITDGGCKTNAAILCIELDRILKLLCGNKFSKQDAFYKKAAYLTKEYNLSNTVFLFLNHARKIRNKIIHASITANKDDAEKLLECVQLLERLQHRENYN